MVVAAYAEVALLPLIQLLIAAFSDVQFKRIRLYFEKLQELGPLWGCFPKPDKSIIVVMEHNKEKAEAVFKFVTGCGYL
jgi:hypothetical protein